MIALFTTVAKVGAGALSQVVGQLLSVAITKRVMARIVIIFIGKFVRSTKTNTDDLIWEQILPELEKLIDG